MVFLFSLVFLPGLCFSRLFHFHWFQQKRMQSCVTQVFLSSYKNADRFIHICSIKYRLLYLLGKACGQKYLQYFLSTIVFAGRTCSYDRAGHDSVHKPAQLWIVLPQMGPTFFVLASLLAFLKDGGVGSVHAFAIKSHTSHCKVNGQVQTLSLPKTLSFHTYYVLDLSTFSFTVSPSAVLQVYLTFPPSSWSGNLERSYLSVGAALPSQALGNISCSLT